MYFKFILPNRMWCLLCCIPSMLLGQEQQMDSLKALLQEDISDSVRVQTYSDLCNYFGKIAQDSALKYGRLAIKLATRTQNQSGLAQAYNDLGGLYYKAGDFDRALTAYRDALYLRLQQQDSLAMARLYHKLGIGFQRKFLMDSALVYHHKALEIYQAKPQKQYVALLRNHIANIYYHRKQYSKALNEHLAVLHIRTKLEDHQGLVHSYTNVGNVYLHLQDTSKSLAYYQKGIDVGESYEFLPELATLYNHFGSIQKEKGKPTTAKEYLHKALQLHQAQQNVYGIASVLLHLGELDLRNGDITAARSKLYRGLYLAKKTMAQQKIADAYAFLLEYHAHRKHTDSVLHYQQQQNKLQQQILETHKTKEIAEIQKKFRYAAKEKETLLQRTSIAEKKLKLQQKKLWLYGLGVFSVLFLVLLYYMYKHHRLKNSQIRQETALNNALTALEAKHQLQDQRLRISRELHDNIGAQLTYIVSALDKLRFRLHFPKIKINGKLQDLSAYAKNTIAELHDSIWAIHKEQISMKDLQIRISKLVEQADLASQGIDFSFQSDGKISDNYSLDTVSGMHVYRILQEGIRNAAEHAKATRIAIAVFLETNHLSIQLSDNGKGFDTGHNLYGNGINIMEKRALEMGADWKLHSTEGQGTRIELRIPS
ncbi:MAG: tetratricopeptide repeat protein [Flavobacteriaceae bacterium]|nr:tetratricopeptide repeat protein [Flavobacteriaceae bacterium]